MILELKNIEKSFGEKKVLTGVSFKAEGGKAVFCLAETVPVKQHLSAF